MSLLNKISYGLYVLCSIDGGGKPNACIVNTLMQQTNAPVKLSVTVSNANYTAELIKAAGKCTAVALSEGTPFDVFKRFGMQSGRKVDKFEGIAALKGENGLSVPTGDYVLGYFELKVESAQDLGSHTQFLCTIENEVTLADGEALTYAYYHKNIKPKRAPESLGYVCQICGHIEKGPVNDDYICPICKHGKESMEKITDANATAPAQATDKNTVAASVKNAVETSSSETKKIKENETKGDKKMNKYVCLVCGYVHTGDSAPEKCPICGAPASKFKLQSEEMSWAAEHVVGIAQGVSEDILEDLRANFNGECMEVGMYLAMARVAHREGYPEVGLYYERAAHEEAEHAARFAELLGEVITSSTKKNLEMRVEAENGATLGKTLLAKKAKEQNLDAIHDTVHEMARDEARHGMAFQGLLNRYFK